MKSEVVILSCESYEEELVYSTLKKGIALLGGWETFLKKEEKILLKPNLVRKTEVERAVITHPAVVKGIVRLLQEEGYVHLSCGDSCGVGSAKKVMEGTGMDQMLEDYGVAIVVLMREVRYLIRRDTRQKNSFWRNRCRKRMR